MQEYFHFFFPSSILTKKKTSYHSFFSHLLRFLHTTLPYVTLFFTTRHPRILNSLCEAIPSTHAQRRRENARIGRPNYQQLCPHPQPSFTRYSAMRDS